MSLAAPYTRLDGPKLMPRRHWARQPSPGEREGMAFWEEKYTEARDFFEQRPSWRQRMENQKPGDIDPARYLHWIKATYHALMRNNADRCPDIASEYERELAIAAARRHMHDPQEMQLSMHALTVGRYGDRVTGLKRGFDATGVRLDAHHMPHDETTSVHREDGTAMAVPEDIHQALHRQLGSGKEKPILDAIEDDFSFLAPRLHARGYHEEHIRRAKEAVHQRNFSLGLYI